MLSFFRFMKHCFDFKGKASRSEYYFSIASVIFIGSIIRACEAVFLMFVLDQPIEIASRISIFSVFLYIGLYSLSCRRLRDAGYSEKTLRWITFPFGLTIAFFISFLPNEIHTKK